MHDDETQSGDESLEQTTSPLRTEVVGANLSAEKLGDRIGRYKLLQQIGEGGCGVVYVAEQEEPVRRRVAIKVIKLGMDTKSVMARFEAERQALALMDHPNIARVLDAGATELGRPYFVMELVRGIKITDYCDQNKVSTTDRLKLFIQVCHAIQHAHQKGIIHRDIKPSNILVTLHDGTPVPKVIDFGIAKATQGRLTDQTVYTAFEQFIGTPAYMSPEQAEMSGLDIDTRCDVYALGVLLYELMTGLTPFDAKELMASGLDKMRQTIREKEPACPSTRLNTMLNAELTTTAGHHRTNALRLVHLLRGDLDWIVMKALEKDRTRRYETANALGTDIQRHLDNEPVMASPPSTLYRFQKLIRRNKSIFAATAGVTVAMAVGFGLSFYFFLQERDAHKRAETAEKEQARLREDAEKRADIGSKLMKAGLMMGREQFTEAEKLVADLPPHPSEIAVYNVLGMIRARQGNTAPALVDFNKSMAVAPDDHEAYYYTAALLADAGNGDAYRALRTRILRQFSETSNPIVAEQMAKACMLFAPQPSDFKALDSMVATAMSAGPGHRSWANFQFVKGLSEYRHGYFGGVSAWMQSVLDHTDDPYLRISASMFLAMTQYQLKQPGAARIFLDTGLKFADEKFGPKGTPHWNDQIMTRVFMNEAKALVNGEKP